MLLVHTKNLVLIMMLNKNGHVIIRKTAYKLKSNDWHYGTPFEPTREIVSMPQKSFRSLCSVAFDNLSNAKQPAFLQVHVYRVPQILNFI